MAFHPVKFHNIDTPGKTEDAEAADVVSSPENCERIAAWPRLKRAILCVSVKPFCGLGRKRREAGFVISMGAVFPGLRVPTVNVSVKSRWDIAGSLEFSPWYYLPRVGETEACMTGGVFSGLPIARCALVFG